MACTVKGKIILTEIDRANDIIYEFLNSSKPSAPQKTVIPIQSLLKEIVLLTESEGLMKGCEIQLNNDLTPLHVSIDVKQIKQVMLNMVKNAMDAINHVGEEHPGMIQIYTHEEHNQVVISIKDNGHGMDHNTLARLFDPFFTTKETGTGLGLSVSYRIIKNHGGAIAVNSKVGEGTNFKISLPLV